MSAGWPFIGIAAMFNVAQYVAPYPICVELLAPILLFLGLAILCFIKGWRA